jgi:hypothetical protein
VRVNDVFDPCNGASGFGRRGAWWPVSTPRKRDCPWEYIECKLLHTGLRAYLTYNLVSGGLRCLEGCAWAGGAGGGGALALCWHPPMKAPPVKGW